LGFRDPGLGIRISGFRVYKIECRMHAIGFRI